MDWELITFSITDVFPQHYLVLLSLFKGRVGIKKKILFCEKSKAIMSYVEHKVPVWSCCDHKKVSRFQEFKEQQKIHIFLRTLVYKTLVFFTGMLVLSYVYIDKI